MADTAAVRLLGPVRLVTGNGAELSFRGHAARLLAWFALRPGRAFSADELAALLWPGGAPATARTAIQGHISRLRRSLRDAEGATIETAAGGYTFRAAPGTVDVERFAALDAEATEALAARRPAGAAERLAAALDLWSGPALADVRAYPPFAAEAQALDDQRRGVEERYALALTEAGELHRALSLLGRLVNEEPLRERRWALLMTALIGAGRQTDALRAYRQAASTLVEHTGLDPGPELQRLETAILVQDPSLDAVRWQPAPGTAPAPLTTLIGRDAEHAALAARLGTSRLVTLVGPGGVGKTTLATTVAAALESSYRDGAVVIDLGTGGPGDVDAAVAAAVGVTRASGPLAPADPPEVPDPAARGNEPLERAAAALARRQVLVVLDNCEHVAADAARVVVALLRAAPGVRVLATSQVPLGVAGEAVVPLGPLAVPGPGAGAAEVQASPAGALFSRRLDDVGCRLVDESDWRHAGTVVRALDGLPLAIEVGAAAARVEPLDALAERLSRDTTVVLDAEPPVGAGRRRLRVALDDAVARLDPATAEVYGLASVFPAGFDAGSLGAVAGVGEAAARRALGRLADASLVVLDPAQRGRARLLQPVRAHAGARIDDDARRAAQDRLAAWAQTLADDLDHRLHSPEQPEVVRRFVAELPVIRQSLRHLADTGDVEGAAVLYSRLVACWGDSPSSPEAPVWGDELLAQAGGLPAGPLARLEVAVIHAQYAFEEIAARLSLAEQAMAHAEEAGDTFAAAIARIQTAMGLGWLGLDYDRCAVLLAEARASFEAQSEAHWAAIGLKYEGLLALRRLDLPRGIAMLEEAAAEHRAHGGPSDVAHALMFIGYGRRATGDLTGALRAFEESRRLLGGTRVVTWLRSTIGAAHAAHALGEPDAAAEFFREAHDRAAEVGDRRVTGTALVGLAVIARRAGDDDRCVALLRLAAAEALSPGGDPSDAATAAGMLAEMLFERDAAEEAAVLLGAAETIDDQVTVRVDFGLAYDDAALRTAVADRLGAERAADMAGEGRAIGVAAAARRATEMLLDADEPAGDDQPPGRDPPAKPALRVVGGRDAPPRGVPVGRRRQAPSR
ncbi:MAG TPA: BTAD domain-containing putative transcriptional regulator [Acidimicrobiales bacterium]|nr:BTAD domain-containing putative transcriptional regulator [Acidimicrobiales bacterium]